MKITPNFSLDEFRREERSVKWHKVERVFPAVTYPREWIPDRLTPLCRVLEIIRAALGGKSIRVGSGYRDRAYNKAIGGAKHSQHMEGRAADIVVAGVPAEDVYKCILELYSSRRIVVGGVGQYPNFTHVDIRKAALFCNWQGSRVKE